MNAPLTTDHVTPGPWMVNKYGSVGAGQYGTLPIVAAMEPLEGPDRKYGDHHANARLIASAPDLLKLAREYASACINCHGHGFTVGDDGVSGRGPDDREPTRYDCEECEEIRAVIAKAEGRL